MIKEIKLEHDDKCFECPYLAGFKCSYYERNVYKEDTLIRLKKCKSDERKLLKRLGG